MFPQIHYAVSPVFVRLFCSEDFFSDISLHPQTDPKFVVCTRNKAMLRFLLCEIKRN